jgi:nitronate monooxygenase
MIGPRWAQTPLAARLGLRWPIIQAPMAGGTSTPEMAIACCEAGALGSIGGAYLAPEALRAQLRAVREKTSRPFAVNLFAPEPVGAPGSASAPDPAQLARAQDALRPFREELGLAEPQLPERFGNNFEALLAVVLEERPAVFSWTFGLLSEGALSALRDAGCYLIGTATTVAEGVALARAGADAVCAQGSEAGGHRGSFLPLDNFPPLVGTLALVPQLVDALAPLPVIAAGGIMDGRGIAAALALGAQAAQLGTAFMRTAEAATPELHRAALAALRDDGTIITHHFTGRYARGVANRFALEQARRGAAVAPFPAQQALYKDVRAAALAQRRPDLLQHWAGQGAPLGRELGCAELIEALARETEEALARLR